MVKYNKVNVKLSDSQLNNLKSAAKQQTVVTLIINIKMFNGNNLPHELILKTRQATKLRNGIENNIPTDIQLSRGPISEMIQSGGFLGSLLSKLAGPLMKVAVSLAKNILAPSGITAAAPAIDAEIQKKIYGSGTTTRIISNEDMNDIMKIVPVFEHSNIILKRVIEKTKNETKEQKRGFLGFLLSTSEASLLGNMLRRKGKLRGCYGNKERKGILTAWIRKWLWIFD